MAKPIAISVDQSEDKVHFDFTYVPTTVHLQPRHKASFRIEPGKAVDDLLLVFEESPFESGETEIYVGRVAVEQTIAGDAAGVYHYKSLGEVEIKGKRRLIYDLWCPSIIVD